VGGDLHLLRKLADLFLVDRPRVLGEIRDAIARGDAPRLRIAAHTLKGAVGNLGACAAFEAALKLEMMGRAGDLCSAAGALAALEDTLDRLEPAVADLMTGSPLNKDCAHDF
jgi:HPt (histidine-containing phosphotransfer) domain-containing protein